MNVVEITDLTKDYPMGSLFGGKRRALDHLTLSVGEGELFGLIGPNGAGKTTTLKLLMNLIFPKEGKAFIMGKPVGDREVRARIGYLPENPYFYDYLTGRELLDYYGRLFGLSRRDRKKRVGLCYISEGIFICEIRDIFGEMPDGCPVPFYEI